MAARCAWSTMPPDDGKAEPMACFCEERMPIRERGSEVERDKCRLRSVWHRAAAEGPEGVLMWLALTRKII